MSASTSIAAGMLILVEGVFGQAAPQPATVPGLVLKELDPPAGIPRPTVAAQPRERVLADPLTIARNLLSRSSETRSLGLRQLGYPEGPSAEVIDLQLRCANLDDDPELEAILSYTDDALDGPGAEILDKTGSHWFAAGRFGGSVTLRDRDILIRTPYRGTGILIWIELEIYRMSRGRLYRVFATTEETEGNHMDLSTGVSTWINERHSIYFPEDTADRRGFLVVHHTRTILGDDEPFTRANIPRDARSLKCTAYRWDLTRFRYGADKAGTAHFCDPKTRRPRH